MTGIKVSSSDGSFAIMNQVLEMLKDNLNTRSKLNDYI
jgi:hypothetical protein